MDGITKFKIHLCVYTFTASPKKMYKCNIQWKNIWFVVQSGKFNENRIILFPAIKCIFYFLVGFVLSLMTF